MSANTIVNYWGLYQGHAVNSVKLFNSSGAFVEILTYGATVVDLVVPDKDGEMDNVILGYPDLESYLQDRSYLGSTIGRFANRIKNACFTLKDKTYYLDQNDGRNTNHGGYHGYHDRIFDFTLIDQGVIMTLEDLDGTGGYPGTLHLKVTYEWNEANELSIKYDATCDKPTIVSLTNHMYFNLSGENLSVINNKLWIDSMLYLENDDTHLPTGNLLKDPDGFSSGVCLDHVIDPVDPSLTGLNRYFILTTKRDTSVAKAKLTDPFSGRQLQVFTSYPGIMIYTGQYLDTRPGRKGKNYQPFAGICLECQHYPDSVNHSHFPLTILHPGNRYQEFINFRFGTLNNN